MPIPGFRFVWRPPQRFLEVISVLVILGFWIYVLLRLSGEGRGLLLLPVALAVVIAVRAWTRSETLEVRGPNLVHTRSSLFGSRVREHELSRIENWRYFPGTAGKGWRYPALRFDHGHRTTTVLRGVDEPTAASVIGELEGRWTAGMS